MILRKGVVHISELPEEQKDQVYRAIADAINQVIIYRIQANQFPTP